MPQMRRSVLLFWLLVGIARFSGAQQDQSDALAEKMFQTAKGLMRDKLYDQAIQDYKTIVNSYPRSGYADNALLELGKYYYQVERNTVEAARYFQQIIENYQGKESTADAYYYKGILLTEGPTTEQQLQDGLANFLRTIQFYPESLVVEEALYRAGVVEQRLQHYEQSAEYFERGATEYPSGVTAPAAQLALGSTLFYDGKIERALTELQRVRNLYPERPEAAVALHWQTLIWRLYYQTKVDPAGVYRNAELLVMKAGAQPVRECAGLVFDAAQVMYVSDPKDLRVHVVGADMRVTGGYAARKPGGVFVGADGSFIVADGTGISTRDRFFPLAWAKGEKRETQPVEKASDAVRTSFGDYFVLDDEGGRVMHFSSSLVFDSLFAPAGSGGVESISVDPQDRLALLFKDSRKINIYDRRGKLTTSIAISGQGYALQEPVEIRFDRFGHLYVLDKSLHAVYAFDRQGKVMCQASLGTTRSPRHIAISDTGDLYVWDDKSAAIVVLR